MATKSLSPNRVAQKLREHRHAVRVLARQSAARTIKAQIRAQGDKLTQVPARTIRVFADAYLDVHRERLIAEAEQIIATSPYFARWRLPPGHELFVKSTKIEHSPSAGSDNQRAIQQ